MVRLLSGLIASASDKGKKATLGDVLRVGRPYWHRYAWGVFVIILVDILEVVPPAVVSLAIDSLKNDSVVRGWLPILIVRTVGRELFALAMVLLVAVCIQWVLRYAWRICFIFTREYVGRDLRRRYFEKLTALPYSFFQKAQTGELMSLATNDMEAVRMMMGPGALMAVDSICYYTFVLALMFAWHVQLTFYLLLVLPFVPFIIMCMSRQIHRRFEHVQKQIALLSAHAQETFAGITVIKGFNREEQEIASFARESRQFAKYSMDVSQVQAVFFPLMLLIIGIESFIILWAGGHAVQRGEISTGEFVGFFLAAGMLAWPTSALAWLVMMYQQGVTSLGRIQKILHEPGDDASSNTPQPQLTGDICLRDVSFVYPEAPQPALSRITLTIPYGKTTAIVGSVGSGKSSLLRLLLKEDLPQQGEIHFGRLSWPEVPAMTLRQQIGYLPQETFLFSTTIAENIAFGLEIADAEVVRWAAEMAVVHDEIMALPQQYETVLGEEGVNLSGGQRQRVALARALARRPAYLLLDDCLSSVDTATEKKILQNLRTVRADTTVVIVTNRMPAIRDAQQIVVLHHGEISECGTHQELLSGNGWYATTYRQQVVTL
jgi:ATP-binding cassette subfamily B protein